MDEEKLSKFVKLPTFDGDEEKFQLWLVRFEAYATCCGFRAAVGDAPEADLPESAAITLNLDPKTDKTAKVAAAVNCNSVAMATLTMAMTTNKTMGALNEAKDNLWPSGVAWKVIKKLKEKTQPMDMMAAVELRHRSLSAVTMKRNKDPKEMFENIANTKARYVKPGSTIPEDELVAVVIGDVRGAQRVPNPVD